MRISVLVTGASTGIGRKIAIDLAEKGHQVFASVRKPEDGYSLRGECPALIPVIMDVTKDELVASALKDVQAKRDASLPFSLVNNAGIAVPGFIEFQSIEDLKYQFEVNLFGVARVTKAFLPLIEEKKGRIINMSSISGLSSAPFLGAYAASKFALEGWSDALRIELQPKGVDLVLIEPGPIATPIWKKTGGVSQEQLPEPYQGALENCKKYVEKSAESAIPAEEVSKVVMKALTSRKPPVRKIVASMGVRAQQFLMETLPARMIDRASAKFIFKS